MELRKSFENYVVETLLLEGCELMRNGDGYDLMRNGDGYLDDEVDIMWKAWQASRASIVIPDRYDQSVGGGFDKFVEGDYMRADEVKRAIGVP